MKSVAENEPTLFATHGYARCSTDEDRQDINRQVRELKAAGAERVWLEFEHGDAPAKEQQEAMFQAANPGDTIITLEVSRLCRSTKQLCEIIDAVRDKHLRLIIMGSITMDCRTGQPDPMTEAFLQIAGVFAQLELSMIRSRVRSGMANARAKGKQIGRPPRSEETIPDTFFRYYSKYKTGEINLSELARLSRLSRSTTYRYISLLEKNNDVKLGRFLSLILRHHPEEAGITLDEHGWADVGALLDGVCSTGRQIDRETLERIVREDSKQRYSFNGDHTKIRANQGHSIQVDVELRKVQPPRYLYHGTATRFLSSIQAGGIKKMNRQYVHLSPDYQTATAVGRRYGVPVVFKVDAGAMAQSGVAFFRSENGVWLCEYVPPEYFSVVGDS